MTIHRKWLFTLVLSASLPAGAYELTVCVVDTEGANNPVYHHLPTTATRMSCETGDPVQRPTLPELYAQGWRLIEVVSVPAATKPGAYPPSPAFYLERDSVPAQAAKERRKPLFGEAFR